MTKALLPPSRQNCEQIFQKCVNKQSCEQTCVSDFCPPTVGCRLWGISPPRVVPGCFLGRPFCTSKQGVVGSCLGIARKRLGILRTEKLPKTGHADDRPGEKRHININFLLWLTSRWPWDKRLVVPELTGPKSLCVRLETQEI